MSRGKLIALRPPVAGDVPASVADDLSDHALVAACATGDSAALGILFDRHHRRVYVFLSRLAGSDQRDLDDFVQTTFLRAMQAAKRYRGDAPVHRWLFAIAAHVVSHHVRGEIRRKAAHVRLAAVPPDHISLGASLERKQLLQAVESGLAELPHKQRVVYVMCELEGIPGVEVARLLDMREGTVWRLLHHARLALRAHVERGGR